MDTSLLPRNLQSRITEALSDTPVVLVNGARQTGKSTLVKALVGEASPERYLTLDSATALAAARATPEDFVARLQAPAVLDEVQRVPELLVALKAHVDADRRPGRFLLTGSAEVLLLPKVSESLAGRMEVLTLWPLSQGEIEGVREGFVDALFAAHPLSLPAGARMADRDEVFRRVVTGGYPEVVRRSSTRRRRAWFEAYVTTLLQRDVRDISNVAGLAELPRLLSLLAARVGSLLNFAELSRSSGIPQTTLKRYMTLLEMTFLVYLMPAWSGNLGKRLTRSPKVMMGDTGLAAALVGLEPVPGDPLPPVAGGLLENFVAMELCKQIAWSETRPRLYHYRTHGQHEVDLVLEDARGRLVGIEVKARSSVGERDFAGLRHLQQELGDRFVRGVVLHTGSTAAAFGANLDAFPLSALWQVDTVPAPPLGDASNLLAG